MKKSLKKLFTNSSRNRGCSSMQSTLRSLCWVAIGMRSTSRPLDKLDRTKAVDILMKDLKVFATFNEDLFKEITHLLTLDNFRENDQLSNYRDTKSARAIMLVELKKLIESNPLFRDKLQYPSIKNSRLRMLINQSLNWQHSLCGNPGQNPDIRTLFYDHSCRNANHVYPQLATNNHLIASVPKSEGFLPIVANGTFQSAPASAPVQTPLTAWISNPTTVAHPVVTGGGLNFISPNPGIAAMPKCPGDDVSRPRFSGALDRVMLTGNNSGQNHHGLAFNIPEELPKTVACTLNQGSAPTSMDFHPIQQTLLLVGTSIGDISLWDVSSKEKLASKSFQVWDIGASSMVLKASIFKDPSVSVKRVLWSPDASLFGVAYSKHMVQLYSYYGGHDIRHHIEIDAHVGSVNDLAFCNPSKQSVITCGDDKTIKVWEVATGVKLCTFEGHEAPVHSICPHSRENVHFVFSTSLDGKIKAWLHGMMRSRVDYDAPGQSCSTMAYSADGKRLFSCGTSQDGESHMVEWNENEGTIKRTYQGFQKHSLGVVQFDTTKNRFLAVGDDYSIKFWDMDNPSLLTTIDAEGGLPTSPRIRFNKGGNLLAVSTNDNRIKILATVDGLCLMRTFEGHSLVTSRLGIASEALIKNGDAGNSEGVKPRVPEEAHPPKTWKLTEISDPSKLHLLRLSSRVKTDKIARLVYTNSGTAILALALNAIHLLWKWPRNDLNSSGKATTKASPQLVQPASGILMTNDLVDARPEEAVPCFALSKNDSYIMSASGGKISLFNTQTFKTMTAFMPPPPAATYLAFHPQDNNIVAVGMDDSTVHIYNVRVDEVKSKLKGHSKRITGLAFSNVLNTLVSSGADSQVIVWSTDRWERKKNCVLQVPAGRTPAAIFLDGTLRVFSASNLQVRCQINPSAYLPSDVSSTVYPLAIAAHPQEPNQFAIGLTDGSVQVFEPLESDSKWGVPPPAENRASGSMLAAPAPPVVALDQPQNME
ncbi:TOPLESS-RELATED PROTEIN 1-RELATED [Salix purpurea]|uniref:TOPLESS-RELATED PROTEIN 1-RELATED n=1 Tax=Salix purpurea TaxID=77065 RepID=A0A9Q0T1D7_SALPP|nr:TOPLESS-RELATED PROTEIN 1-RELATED [Salix purpurea]